MNRRTLLLAAGGIAVLLLYLLDSGYRSWIETPTTRYEGELNSVKDKLSDANAEQITGRRLANQLQEYAKRALPHDSALARSRYQDWLLRLVERHKMESAAVDAELPRPIEIRSRTAKRKSRLIGHSIGFTLRARTSLRELTDFLYDFHRSGQLHKIRSFSLTPLASGDQLDLNLAIDTLALEATERSGELSDSVREADDFPPRPSFDEFVKRNLFAKGFSKSLGQVRLNAITQNRLGQQEAWFAVGSPPKTQIVVAGGSLDIPLHQVQVTAFDQERVSLDINGSPVWIQLGQTLGDVLDIPESTAESTAVADEPPAAEQPPAVEEIPAAEQTTPVEAAPVEAAGGSELSAAARVAE